MAMITETNHHPPATEGPTGAKTVLAAAYGVFGLR
jgi:hypothetical protein